MIYPNQPFFLFPIPPAPFGCDRYLRNGYRSEGDLPIGAPASFSCPVWASATIEKISLMNKVRYIGCCEHFSDMYLYRDVTNSVR